MEQNYRFHPTLDTKGAEVRFVEEIIRKRGHIPFVIDIGVLRDRPFRADISSREISRVADAESDSLRERGNKAEAMQVMN